MAEIALVDTDILIDFGRGVGHAANHLDTLAQRFTLSISAVTQMELIIGCRNKTDQNRLDAFLRRFQVLPVTETICTKAVDLLLQYRLSHGLLIVDAFIAATALTWQTALTTKNQRDFRFVADLHVLPYP
jgi:predicted nucleic acid-binding protein